MKLSSSSAPTLYFETSSSGKAYVRVEEQKITDFDADVSFADKTIHAKGVYAGVDVKTNVDASITNYDVSQERVGISLRKTDDVNIYDFKFDNFSVNKPEKFGAVIRIGDDTDSNGTTGITYVQRVQADGHQEALYSKPGHTYATSNKDFMAVEHGGNVVYVRDITAENFSDGMFDVKGENTIYIMNATLDSSHRILRVWDNAKIVLVNSEIITAPGHAAIWLQSANATVEYYNTTWNGQSTIPTSLISRESKSISFSNVQKLDSNPFADIEFFHTDVRNVHLEYSVNGKDWVEMDLGNAGELGSVGDNLFSVDSLAGNYYVRSYYTLHNGTKSEFSDVIHHKIDGSVEMLPIEDFLNLPLNYVGTDGADTVDAGDNGSIIATGSGMDVIIAGHGADHINGGAKNDTVSYVRAEQGIHLDLLDNAANAGGASGDVLTGVEMINGSNSNDVILGGNGENRLFGEGGNDRIDGRSGHDWLNGGSGNDTLVGGFGNDRLEGSDGQDVLIGGAGADTYKGGSGADMFVFTRDGLGSTDRVLDFSLRSNDKLDFQDLFAGKSVAGDDLGDYLIFNQVGNDAVVSWREANQPDQTVLIVNNTDLSNWLQLVQDGTILV